MTKLRLHLSLTAPGMDGLQLTQWGLTLLTVGSLTIAGCIWWYAQELETQSYQIAQQTNELRQRDHQLTVKAAAQGIDLSHTRLAALPKEITFAKQVRRQLGFSWTQFLNDLESSVPTNVSMESVKVNFKEASISLTGSAKALADINRLADKLDGHPSFHHVVLSQHAIKRKKKNSKDRFVLFTMTVQYDSIKASSVKS